MVRVKYLDKNNIFYTNVYCEERISDCKQRRKKALYMHINTQTKRWIRSFNLWKTFRRTLNLYVCLKRRVHCVYKFQPKIIRKHVVNLFSKFQAILWEYFPTQFPIANPRMSQNFGISSCSISFYIHCNGNGIRKKFKEQAWSYAECIDLFQALVHQQSILWHLYF